MVIMVLGCPASGKSTQADAFARAGHVLLNRDTEGGKVVQLLPKMVKAIRGGKDVVLDNLFATSASRAPFIKAAKDLGAEIQCVWMKTSIEDAQINALFRMYSRYGRLFLHSSDLKAIPKDPNMFPIVVLFKYRKDFEKPSASEGFSKITHVPFKRIWPAGHQKAVLLDYDDTLRTTVGGDYKFPTDPSQIRIMDRRVKKLGDMVSQGYVLLGVSNQSGVAKGMLTAAQAEACFAKTNRMLGHDIHVEYCPHSVPPISCYCRKPQSGIGVKLIVEYQLDVSKCIVVGDQTTDKSFAKRLGMQFSHASQFFRG